MIKRIVIILALLLISTISLLIIDCIRVLAFYDTPVFAQKSNEKSFDDGGSGIYIGLGYSFDIMGRFIEYRGNSKIYGARLYLIGTRLVSYNENNKDHFNHKTWVLWRKKSKLIHE